GADDVGHRRRAGRDLRRQPARPGPPARARAVGHLLLRPRLPRLDGELQRLLQPARPDPLLGPPRHRDGDRDASERQAPHLQRHLPLRAGRVGMRGVLGAAGRGLASGAAVGAIWWAVEAVLNWTTGGLVAGAVSLRIAALDVGIAVRHGALLGEPSLPVLLAVLPLLGVAADRALGLLVTRRGVRLGLEVAGGALAVALLGHPLASAPLEDPITTALPPPAGAPDVILVSLDPTPADPPPTYGYGRETSPHLTAFAADALLFTQAHSPAAWTLPAHASLFTGMYPSRHGAHLAGGFLPGRSIDGHRRVAFPLPEERVTLAEALRDRGYRTAAFAANFSYLYRSFGVAQGFGPYDDAPGLLF